MNAAQRDNLRRLLSPRHVVFIGGESAVFAAGQCAAGNFRGEIWGLNPQPKRFGTIPSYTSVEALPEPPDAVFLAVPRQGVPAVVAELREKVRAELSATPQDLVNWAMTALTLNAS